MFENYSKCRIFKLQVFKNSSNWTIFAIFDEFLSTQNVNVARFARNVECDFLADFQTLCEMNPNEFLAVYLALISLLMLSSKHQQKNDVLQ